MHIYTYIGRTERQGDRANTSITANDVFFNENVNNLQHNRIRLALSQSSPMAATALASIDQINRKKKCRLGLLSYPTEYNRFNQIDCKLNITENSEVPAQTPLSKRRLSLDCTIFCGVLRRHWLTKSWLWYHQATDSGVYRK